MKYWGNTLDYRHIFIITGLLQISHVAASLLLISLGLTVIAWLYVRWTMGVITTHNPTMMNRGTLVSVSFS